MTEEQKRLDSFAQAAPEVSDARIDAYIKDIERRTRVSLTQVQARCDLAWEYARTMIAREKK